MKKVLIMALCFLLLIATDAVAQYKYRDTGGASSDTDCSTYTTANKFCRDTDDNKVYIGTGSTVAEVGSGSGSIATDTIWDAAGDTVYGTGANTSGRLAKGTAYQLYMMNSGATAPAWTSTLGATGTRLTAGYFTNIYGTGMTTGVASATAGTLNFLNATNANAFTITSGVSGAAIGWTLPTAAPGGANYLLNVDADGTMGYTDPAGLGGGYTNLTSFIDQTAWRVFYSDGSGDVKELALGSDGTYLRSNGASSAPTFDTPTGAAHDALTLGATATDILGLSTQELGFDTQTTNYVLAGPTTGAAAAPTFRALVSGDIPNNAADTSGNAGTATALAADPADCAAGQVATGIAASGALSCTATPSVTTLTGAVTGVASGNIANTLADAAGDMIYATADNTWAKLAKGTAAQMLQMNSGATAPEWTSTLSITGIDLTAGTFNIPNGTTALNTGAGRIYFNTTSKAFSIGDGSTSYYAPTSLAPLSFTTGGTTARTMTLPNADSTLLYSGGALGTPSGGTLTNATGLPVSTGIAGLGTNVATALAVNVGSAGAPVLFNGAGGTPTSLNLSNAVINSGTSLPGTCTVGNLFLDTDADTNGTVYSCIATNTWKDIDDDGGAGGMATTDIDTSSEVLGIVTDETGSASGTPLLVFNQAPRIDNIELGAATDTTIHRESAGVVSIEGATILTNTVPAVFDGKAAANLTAAAMSDPRCTVTNYGQTTADVAVTLPTAAANLSCLFNVGTAQSGNKWGVRANTNDKIYLIAAAGTISAGDDNGYARMTAAQVGQSFACWSFTTGSGAYDWQCKAISIGSSTFAAN